MNPVAKHFEFLREKGQKALITYVMGGFPDLSTSVASLKMLADCGADLIEVGIPFSDPLADGQVIQAAGQTALSNGCDLKTLMEAMASAVKALTVPVVVMVYYNMIFQRGVRRFLGEIKECGFSGVIVPDLPPEEAEELQEVGREFDLGLNFLVAPTSTDERIRTIGDRSTGFIYAVALKGVTGVRDQLPPDLPAFVDHIRQYTTKPVAVGFGIAEPWQARAVTQYADGVIVGSAIVQSMAKDTGLALTGVLIRKLRQAIDGV